MVAMVMYIKLYNLTAVTCITITTTLTAVTWITITTILFPYIGCAISLQGALIKRQISCGSSILPINTHVCNVVSQTRKCLSSFNTRNVLQQPYP